MAYYANAVIDIVKIAHTIVGHFKHSSSATDRLRSLQTELNLAQRQLVQDVATRWISTFYLLQLEQCKAITLFCAENDSVTNLSSNQWSVVENVATVLQPFEEATREVSSATFNSINFNSLSP